MLLFKQKIQIYVPVFLGLHEGLTYKVQEKPPALLNIKFLRFALLDLDLDLLKTSVIIYQEINFSPLGAVLRSLQRSTLWLKPLFQKFGHVPSSVFFFLQTHSLGFHTQNNRTYWEKKLNDIFEQYACPTGHGFGSVLIQCAPGSAFFLIANRAPDPEPGLFCDFNGNYVRDVIFCLSSLTPVTLRPLVGVIC